VSLEPNAVGITEDTETEAKDKIETRVVLDLRKSDEEGMMKE
jgi:hypothetical protein